MVALSTAHWPPDDSRPILEATVGDLLRMAAGRAPDTVALVEGAADAGARRRWTYAALLEQAERAARALLGRFAPGIGSRSGRTTSRNGSCSSWPPG